MKNKSKLMALAGVAILSTAVLAACGGGSKKDAATSASSTYSYVYSTDPKSLDYVLTNQRSTSDVTTQLVDGLLENDKYGNLVPSLAKDWKVSADGLTYTYTLRDGVKWFTSDGEEYADLVAEDFVTGLKHAIDGDSESLYIIENSIKNLKEYKEGKVDFSEVGIKAVDEKTVQYTLNSPEPYWNSKTTYGILFPVNAKFLESKGKDFGSADASSILVNGAYFLSAYTAKSSMEFSKNADYWDAENVSVESVKLTFFDGTDPGALFTNFDKGAYSVARVFPNDPTYETVKKNYSDAITYGLQDTTTYYTSLNLNRSNFKNSKKDAAQQDAGKKALLNKDFRQALTFAFDRAAYNSQNVGEEAKEKALRNTLVPPTFVSVGEKSYGDVVKEELSGLGDEWKDVDLSDAQDGLYNPEKAKAEFAKAKEALSAQGVTFPIQLDYPVAQTHAVNVQQAQSMKQSVEAALGAENVVINVIELDETEYENSTYYAESPEQLDYDIMVSGWGPDYTDPSTYLDILDPDAGATILRNGIAHGQSKDLVESVGLKAYAEQVKKANAIKDDVAKRYAEHAKAEAQLLDSAIIIPIYSLGGSPRVSKVVPFAGAYGSVGIKGSDWYKALNLQDEPVTVKEYKAAREAWLKEKAKSNAEAEAKLADHVEK